MIKKTIEYVDFDGKPCTDTLYFHLNHAEANALDKSVPGGVDKLLKSGKGADIFDMFNRALIMGYGEKNADGKHFNKSSEMTTDFVQSAAYEALIYGFLKDNSTVVPFFQSLMPKMENL